MSMGGNSYPVAMSQGDHGTLALRDDGACFILFYDSSSKEGRSWKEIPPMPGTPRALELMEDEAQ